ncbi:hypothetical protein LX64_04738 [Chitinophaga skermanii]|uniref:VCBS repeat protein n=1 Tax=Chitinophaga skermanii TaxID=331697 RepID=A0A327Q467_9BACT|nr:hypothetical protein [Chitinophaga skermanii]RAI98753.1 hypothetical protein LX64_04738 [Chitinophaga skermanii]
MKKLYPIAALILFTACGGGSKTPQQDSTQVTASNSSNTAAQAAQTVQNAGAGDDNLSESVNTRETIDIDLDGDGRPDKLSDILYSKQQEAIWPGYPAGMDYEMLDSITWENQIFTYYVSNIAGADTLKFALAPSYGSFYFRNIGDLNDDGREEVGVIANYMAPSNLNTFYVFTLTADKKWQELHSFGINKMLNMEDELLGKGVLFIKKTGPKQAKYAFYNQKEDIFEIDTATITFK